MGYIEAAPIPLVNEIVRTEMIYDGKTKILSIKQTVISEEENQTIWSAVIKIGDDLIKIITYHANTELVQKMTIGASDIEDIAKIAKESKRPCKQSENTSTDQHPTY